MCLIILGIFQSKDEHISIQRNLKFASRVLFWGPPGGNSVTRDYNIDIWFERPVLSVGPVDYHHMLTTWRRPSQSSKVCLFKINQLHIISQMQHVLWIQHLNSFYKFMTVLLWIGKVPYLAVEKRFKIAPKWSRVVHIISVSKQCSTLELKLLHNWTRTGFCINGLFGFKVHLWLGWL